MQNSPFTVVDFISLTPNKCVVYPRFFRNNKNTVNPDGSSKVTTAPTSSTARTTELKTPPISNAHNFELSKTAQKNLREKVTWLYHYAKKKTVITKKGKQLTNFKMNFATLKLPSEQIHSSDFITKNCLNQLFIEISKKYDFKNYVWRLEYQKNGNLHYHIATDTYIDYHFLMHAWNRILNKYGYVDLYTRKHSEMSLSDYVKANSFGGAVDYNILQERYAKGCRENWKNPNSVDVKAVFGANNIAYYISKYMAKSKTEKEAITLPICEQNSANSRLWFCSRSLSRCERISDPREALEIDLYGILRNAENTVHKFYDYCTVIYFDFQKLAPGVRAVVRKLLEYYRREVEYTPCG